MVKFERVYVDSSVIVRLTLNQPGALHDVSWEFGLASDLIIVEFLRTMDHLRHVQHPPDEEIAGFREIGDRNLARLNLLPIDSLVLRRAGSAFPTPLKTVDAIHLASALLWVENMGTPLVFLTHDRQLATAVRSCGLHVYPVPIEPV